MSEKMAVVLKKDSVAPPSPYDLANKKHVMIWIIKEL